MYKNDKDLHSQYHFGPANIFPFKPILDETNRTVDGVVAITAPLYPSYQGKKEWDEFRRLVKSGVKFIGVSSYQEFPMCIVNPHEKRNASNFFTGQPEVAKHVIGWLTCGRREHERIPKHLNPILLSECDFLMECNYTCARTTPKKYDFLYYCASSAWSEHCRNFKLAKRLIPLLLRRGMTIVIVGAAPNDLERRRQELYTEQPGITLLPMQPWDEFQSVMKQCRYLFLPNISDAAPRTMIECFWRNIPAIVNASIHGGWKHVNRKTAVTFSTVDDFEDAVDILVENELHGKFQPRAYLQEFHKRVQPRRLLYDYVNGQREAFGV